MSLSSLALLRRPGVVSFITQKGRPACFSLSAGARKTPSGIGSNAFCSASLSSLSGKGCNVASGAPRSLVLSAGRGGASSLVKMVGARVLAKDLHSTAASLSQQDGKGATGNQLDQHRAAISSGATTATVVTEEKTKIQRRVAAIINFFPGDTLFQKTATMTIGGGLFATLISLDLYLPTEETISLAAFLIAVRILYMLVSKPMDQLLQENLVSAAARFKSAFENQKAGLLQGINYLESFLDHDDVVHEFFEIKRENVTMAADLSELQQTRDFLQGIKNRLNELVRAENERRAQERKQIVDGVITGVMADLKDPKLQDSILSQCITDLDKIGGVKA